MYIEDGDLFFHPKVVSLTRTQLSGTFPSPLAQTSQLCQIVKLNSHQWDEKQPLLT